MPPKSPPPPADLLPMLPVMMALASWQSSPLAWRTAKSAWPLSKEQKQSLRGVEAALRDEAQNRTRDLLAGLTRYLAAPAVQPVASVRPAIWRRGSARLLDYGYGSGRPILFAPSLINRYYILNLEGRSLLSWLAEQGLRPLVLDWGAPGEAEEAYDCADYVTRILAPAIRFAARHAGQPVTLAGYCMGGVLSLAAAGLCREHLRGLALLATPWNFHCAEFATFRLDDDGLADLRRLIASRPFLPAQAVLALFMLADPFVFEHKFRRFAGMPEGGRLAREFIALEHWVNDGVPLTAGVAEDCLIGWAQENRLMNGGWKVGHRIVRPQKLDIPALVAMPKNDHVVPPDCARPLAAALPHAELLAPGAGHVGMIVGTRARRELWQPLFEWTSSLA